jgi:ABC-type branched-subunit amino acid transport system permease subunit
MIDSSTLVYTVAYFFMIYTVAKGMALIIGHKRLLYLALSVPVLIGGLTASAVTTRLTYLFAEMNKVTLLPWASAVDWVENSRVNADLVSNYIANNPLIGISIFLVGLFLSFILAGFLTWVSAKPALKLPPEYLAIYSYTLPSFVAFLSLQFPSLGGGYTGVYIPDVFAFVTLNKEVLFLLISALAALLVIRLDGSMLTSYAEEIGLDFDGFVLIIGGGIIGAIGFLYSLRYLFVVQANYTQNFWGWWPLLMIVLADFKLGKKLLVSVFGVQLMRAVIVNMRTVLVEFIFFPIAYIEQVLLGFLLIVGLIVYQHNRVNQKNDSTGV